MHIVHINCNLNLLSLYSIPCSKIKGSAVEAFIQLTVFNLCHDKENKMGTHCELPVYCACESAIKIYIYSSYNGLPI